MQRLRQIYVLQLAPIQCEELAHVARLLPLEAVSMPGIGTAFGYPGCHGDRD
jgi:hypothetical protein